MIQTAYTLHDVKACTYSPPFWAINDAIAKRMVSEIVTDTNTTVGRHPSDYKLYKLGLFDDSNGQIVPFNIIEHVVDCVALLPMSKQSDLFSHEPVINHPGNSHFEDRTENSPLPGSNV